MAIARSKAVPKILLPLFPASRLASPSGIFTRKGFPRPDVRDMHPPAIKREWSNDGKGRERGNGLFRVSTICLPSRLPWPRVRLHGDYLSSQPPASGQGGSSKKYHARLSSAHAS